MPKKIPDEVKADIIASYFELIEVNNKLGKGKNDGAPQRVIAERFGVAYDTIRRIISTHKRDDANPTRSMVVNAEKLKNVSYQLEEVGSLIENSKKRNLRVDEKIDELEDFEDRLKTALTELEGKIESMEENDYVANERDINAIKAILTSKNSPMGYATLITQFRNLMAELRKNDQAIPGYLDTINNAQKVVIAINNMYYGGDPSTWDQATAERATTWFTNKICPRCPGYDIMLKDSEYRVRNGNVEKRYEEQVEDYYEAEYQDIEEDSAEEEFGIKLPVDEDD